MIPALAHQPRCDKFFDKIYLAKSAKEILHLLYILEYVLYILAASDNPTVRFKVTEELFDFTRIVDVVTIVGFFGTMVKVMLIDDKENWPRVVMFLIFCAVLSNGECFCKSRRLVRPSHMQIGE